jgi:hypothetical protein
MWAMSRKENTMIIRHTSFSVMIVSGMLLFGGCAFVHHEPRNNAPIDRSQSTTLAGSYKDIGSDGSIKPHPDSSYEMSRDPQRQTTGSIILGGEEKELPDLRTGTMKKEPERTTPPSGLNPKQRFNQ